MYSELVGVSRAICAKRRESMYTKTAVLPVSTGVAVLPNTGNNRVLFVTAIVLMTVGVVAFVASFVAGRKSQAAVK